MSESLEMLRSVIDEELLDVSENHHKRTVDGGKILHCDGVLILCKRRPMLFFCNLPYHFSLV